MSAGGAAVTGRGPAHFLGQLFEPKVRKTTVLFWSMLIVYPKPDELLLSISGEPHARKEQHVAEILHCEYVPHGGGRGETDRSIFLARERQRRSKLDLIGRIDLATIVWPK